MSAIQPIRLFVASVALALSVVATTFLFSPASAQTPAMNCAPPLGRGTGQAVTAGSIQVLLPVGYSYVWNAPSVGSSGGILRICVLDYFAQIELNADTGAEISRVSPIPSGMTVLDIIAASAHLTNPPTPTPVPQVVSPAVGAPASTGIRSVCTGVICPPNTGDAGLR